MIGELEIDGVFIPSLLALGVGSFFVTLGLRAILRRVNFYRLVWHAGLFDTALYLVVLWVAALVTIPGFATRIGL